MPKYWRFLIWRFCSQSPIANHQIKCTANISTFTVVLLSCKFLQSILNYKCVCAMTSCYFFTVMSFIDMVNYLFSLPGVRCFLSERISQDPLEKFFGCQRQRGGVNENPTVQEFCQNTQALRVINSVRRDVRGNCRGNKGDKDSHQENAPLNKRRANRHKK